MLIAPSGIRSRHSLAGALLTVSLALAPPLIGDPGWKSLGPGGGLVRSLAVDPSNSNVIYAVGYSEAKSGIQVRHKSTDRGLTWKLLSIPGLDRLPIADVDVDPLNSEVVYVSSTAGPICKTTDGGVTWVSANLAGAMTVAASPSTPGLVFAGVANRLYSSTNRGEDWKEVLRVSAFLAEIQDLVFDPSNPSRLYVVGRHVGVLMTDDAGDHWTSIGSPTLDSVESLAIDPRDPLIIYAGTEMTGPYKTTNGGATWSSVNFTSSNLGVLALAIDPANPDTVFMGTRLRSIYKSEDGGLSWQKCQGTLLEESMTVNSLVVFADHPGTVLAGCENVGIFRSDDAGQNWEDSNDGMPARGSVNSLTADPYDSHILYAATQEGMYRSIDRGEHWHAANGRYTAVNGSTSAVVVNPAHPSIVYRGGFGFARSTNRGDSWQQLSLVDLYTGLATDTKRPNVLWAAKFGVEKSTDAGTNWKPMDPGHSALFVAIDPFNPDTIFAGNRRTRDGSVSWTTMDLSNRVAMISVSSVQSGLLYAGWSRSSTGFGRADFVSAYRYLIPYFQKGFDPTSQVASTTGIAFANPSNAMPTVFVTGHAGNGLPIPVPTNPNLLFVSPGSSQAKEVWQLFDDNPNAYREGWLEATSNVSLGALFMFGNPDRMDGSTSIEEPSKILYFTRVFEGATAFRGRSVRTRLHVTNPGVEPVTIKMSLFGCSEDNPCAEIHQSTWPEGHVLRNCHRTLRCDRHRQWLCPGGGYLRRRSDRL